MAISLGMLFYPVGRFAECNILTPASPNPSIPTATTRRMRRCYNRCNVATAATPADAASCPQYGPRHRESLKEAPHSSLAIAY